MLTIDVEALAAELMDAYARGHVVSDLPSSRAAGLDLPTAYAVAAELTRLRRAAGRRTVGRKVGFANKAMWRALGLETVAWAHMYDDTVRHAEDNRAVLSLAGMCSPRIETEIVFRLKNRVAGDNLDAAAVLREVEWLAVGFEIVDCVFPDWKFQPADFVAAFGLHAALIVGESRPVVFEEIPALVDQLSRFTVRLSRDGELVQEGSGKNALRSPALSLAELASAAARQTGADPVAAGELVSTGTLTGAQPISAGETWTATLDGLALPPLTLVVST